MKKVFNQRVLVRFAKDTEWHDTSVRHHYIYAYEEIENESFQYEMASFKQAYEFIKNNYLRNAEITRTLFTKKLQIRISVANPYDGVIAYTEKNFKPFEVKIVYENADKVSLSTLADLLSADAFCEYLQDRKISYTNF